MKASELRVGDVVCYNDDDRAFGDMLVIELDGPFFHLLRPYVNLDGPVPLAAMEKISVHETSNLHFTKRRFSPFAEAKLRGENG